MTLAVSPPRRLEHCLLLPFVLRGHDARRALLRQERFGESSAHEPRHVTCGHKRGVKRGPLLTSLTLLPHPLPISRILGHQGYAYACATCACACAFTWYACMCACACVHGVCACAFACACRRYVHPPAVVYLRRACSLLRCPLKRLLDVLRGDIHLDFSDLLMVDAQSGESSSGTTVSSTQMADPSL